MATIRNRKKEPLSQEEVLKKFPYGIGIYNCDDGVCLIFGLCEGYHQARVVYGDGAQNDDRWWADLRSILKEKYLPPNPTGYDREPLENEVNSALFGLPPRRMEYCLVG